jgi:hypothetical protein
MPPSWSVVATVDEPAAVVVAFVLHHLEAGASEVNLFLDGPNPEAEEALAGIAEAQVVVCDEAHWAASVRRKKPRMHPGRQMVNANIAYQSTKADWLLHCDCDEFVSDGAALAEELGRLLPKIVFLRLLVSERAYTGLPTQNLFEGVFRYPLDEFAQVGPPIYGDLVPFLKDGVTGHRAGKGVVRTGIGIDMGIHSPTGSHPHRKAKTRLLHFDGLTRLHYMIKLLRRAHEPPMKTPLRHGPARIAQYERFCELVATPSQAAALVEALKSLTRAQCAELRAMEALDERPFQPLGRNPLADGLTVARIDADLRLRYETFLQSRAPELLIP